MKAAAFKARCLSLMDEVARRNSVIVVTKRGKPVAELRAFAGKRPKSIIGLHRGRIGIKGDVLGPIDVSWKALE